ncbi:MAG: TPM domain-containing protein [Deltaproteobacteria bacterium]|nr:TPM domain-containing protein [Deltaproteobacteria bacterium]
MSLRRIAVARLLRLTAASGELLQLTAAALLIASSAFAAPVPVPTPLGFVSDYAHVIDAATAAALTGRIEELKRKTGAEIAVVTVTTTKPEATFDYAMRLAEAWKPGAAGKDNGVVFLTAVADHDLFILTGYGIGGVLPDGLVGEIRDREIVPRFRAGDVAGGIRAGVERMAAIIAREYGVTLSGAPPAPDGRREPTGISISPGLLLLLLLLFFIVLPMLTSGIGGRRRGGLWMLPMWGGGFGGGGFGGPGGGFGGFGGGGFGGGGAGGKW